MRKVEKQPQRVQRSHRGTQSKNQRHHNKFLFSVSFSVRTLCPLWLLFLAFGTAPAQTIHFDFNLPASRPAEYHLTLASSGDATFDEPATDSQEACHSVFRVDATRTADVFASAKALNYFQGTFDYKRHKIANTGEKRLSYEQDGKITSTTFNYSENQTIRQLTDWFQAVATTQEFARKARFARRFDKLSLDADVKNFADNVKAGQAAELQSIRPLLEEMAADPTILKTVRERIKGLLAVPSGS